MTSNFNTVKETRSWPVFTVNGTHYNLSHLDAHNVTYVDQKNLVTYRFIVTYSDHCFTKKSSELTNDWVYSHGTGQRHFHTVRYELSKQLKEVIENLPNHYVVHGGRGSGNYANSRLIDVEGNEVEYFIVFKVFTENKRYRIHVLSAYPKDEKGKYKKVQFFTIAYNLSKNKRLPRP